MNRRHLLRLSGAALASAVAGCGQGEETDQPADGGDATPTASPTETPADGTETPTASPTVDPTATAEPTPTPTATAEPTPTATPTPSPTPRDVAQVVTVGDSALAFAPDSFEISVGETVVWVWHSSGHNVRPESTPSGSDFSGTPGGDGELYDDGHEFSFTFETPGEYEYYCNPHRSAGMTGSFTVTE